MHPSAGLPEAQAVFVARSLQATGFCLSTRSRRIHKIDNREVEIAMKIKQKNWKLVSEKRARKIAANPGKVRGFSEIAKLAESYLVAIAIVKEQRATIAAME